MPSSKGRGNSKDSPQKKAVARRVHTRSTKSNLQARIEASQIDTLATISSPKPKPNPKKLTPPSRSTTSPLPTVGKETLERGKPIAQAVTETKQDNIEEEEEKSTESDSSHSSVIQVGTTINLSSMADSRLDKQLNHVLTEYYLAVSVNHEVRQMFKETDLYQFEDFIICDMQSLTEMRRKKHNTTVGFVYWKHT